MEVLKSVQQEYQASVHEVTSLLIYYMPQGSHQANHEVSSPSPCGVCEV